MYKKNIKQSFILVIIIILAIIGCTDMGQLGEDAVKAFYEEDVEDAIENLSESSVILASGDTINAVSDDFTLPETGDNGTTITWESSDTDIISISEDGTAVVTRPSGNDEVVTLTATITKGSISHTKTITVTVSGLSPGFTDSLSSSDIIGPNPDLDNVTTDLNLPAAGDDGHIITWSSSNTSVITDSGLVTRPAAGSSNVTVTMTAVITDGTNTITKDFSVTVLALDTVTHTVTFHANGGSGTMEPQTIAEGSSANLSANLFTKTGFTFVGWAATSGGAVAYNNQANCIMGSSDVNLYAVWTANTHTITFNSNGGTGTMSPQSIAEGESVNLSANNFTKTDCTFAGWSTTAGGALIYADKQEYTMGSSDQILYAKWTDSDNLLIKLTFDDQNCTDTSGNNKTCTGNNMSYADDGNGGYAASFNGSSSFIKLPDAILHTLLETAIEPKPKRETFTIMMRFKAEAGQKGVLLGYQNTTVGTQPNQFIPIIMLQSDAKLRGTLWTTANDITVLSTNTVDDGNWHTVYFSAKSNSIALYLDGEQIGSATGTVASLSMIYNQVGTSFGRARDPYYSTDDWFYFNGLIDEFYLYSTAMH